MTTPTQSPGLLSYFQIPETFDFVSLHSADGWIELLLFIHNDLVTIPNAQRKILAEIQNINDGEYYIVHLHYQLGGTSPLRFATASAFVHDNSEEGGCEIIGFAELTTAIPLFGVILFVAALLVYLATGVGWIAFVVALLAYILATRGALKWRDLLIQQLLTTAQILPQTRIQTEIEEMEVDDYIHTLVQGIQQGT